MDAVGAAMISNSCLMDFFLTFLLEKREEKETKSSVIYRFLGDSQIFYERNTFFMIEIVYVNIKRRLSFKAPHRGILLFSSAFCVKLNENYSTELFFFRRFIIKNSIHCYSTVRRS